MTIDDCRLLICEGKIPTSAINNRHSAIINRSREEVQQRKFVHFTTAIAVSGKLTSPPQPRPRPTGDVANAHLRECIEIAKMLNGLIRSIRGRSD